MSEQSLGEPTDPNSDGFIHPVNSFFLDEDISHCLSVLEVREMFVEYRLKAGITIKIEVAGSQLGNAVAKFPPNLMTPKAQKNFVKYNELYELYRLSKAATSPRKTKSPRVSDHKSPRGAWSPRVSSDSIAKSPRVLSQSSELRYSRERLEGSGGSRNVATIKIDPLQPLSPNFTLKIPSFNQPPDPNQPRIEPSNSTTSPRGIQPSSPRNQFSPGGNPVSPRSNDLYRSPKSPRVNNNPPARQTASPRTIPNHLPQGPQQQQQIHEPSPLSRSTEGLPHSPRSTPIGEFSLPPLSRSSEITRSDVPFLLSRTAEIHRSPRGVSSPNDPQVQPKSPGSNDHPQPISPRSPRSTPTTPSATQIQLNSLNNSPSSLDPVVQIQPRSPRSLNSLNSLNHDKSPRGVGVVGQQPQNIIDVLSLPPRTTLNEGLSPRRLVTSPGSKEKSHSLDEQNKALNELENS